MVKKLNKQQYLGFEVLTAVVTKSTFFFNLVCGAIGTAATRGLLCQPRVIVKIIVEK
jgi:hypothetical protein